MSTGGGMGMGGASLTGRTNACGETCGPVCGESCGEACGGGFDQYSQMGYVGAGGDYAPATYQFVGKGAGQFGLIEQRIPRPANCMICLPIGCILLTLLLLPLLYYLLQPGTVTTTLPPPVTTTPPPVTTSLPFDCLMGNSEMWSGGKKLYCCEKLSAAGQTPSGCRAPVITGSGDGPIAIG